MLLLAATLLALLAYSNSVQAAAKGTPCCAPDTKLQLGRCADGKRIQLACESLMLVGPAIGTNEKLKVDDDGILHVEPGGKVYMPNEYCVNELFVATDEVETTAALVCLPEALSYDSHRINGIIMLASVVFVLLTIGVYTLLPELRDLQGKCVMCMCVSMAIGFTNLAIIQLSQVQEGAMCHAYGFMLYFWLLAMFFWMNVICIHMWVTAARKTNNRAEGQQFAYYSLYAWGVSFVFLIVALLTNYTEGHLSPGIGLFTCWFKGPLETWIYFYGPIGILLTVNVGLFIATSGLLWQNTASMHIGNLTLLKYRFTLYLKLYLLTGMSWICEVASFAHGQNTILWYITDTINCLQGLIIFLVLVVFRKRAVRGLADAGYLPCLKDIILRWCLSNDDVECEGIVPQDDLEQPTHNQNLEDLSHQPRRESND